MFRLGTTVVVFGMLLSGGTFAADLPPLSKARALAYYDWTGFYVGGNGGYSVGRDPTNATVARTFNGDVQSNESFTMAPAGWVGGIQFGYNRQVGRAVLGVEVDWQWTGQRDRGCLVTCLDQLQFDGPNRMDEEHKLDWFATARVRAGYAGDHWLWYVTAGPAFARLETNSVFVRGLGAVNAPAFPTTVAPSNVTSDRVGLALGTGIETALSANWSAKIEYLYLDLGSVTSTLLTVDPQGGPFAGLAVTHRTAFHDHIVRAGINYRFGGGEVAAAGPGGFFKAPRAIAAQPYNWTGVYVGGNAGYGVARNPTTATVLGIANIGPPVLNQETFTQAPAGALGGGQIGFNWQIDHFVAGVEADGQWAGQQDSGCVNRCANFGSNLPTSQKLNAFATARARIGYAANSWLWYVTGGAAWGKVSNTFTFDQFGTVSFDQNKYGWVAGAGVEAAIGANWSAKLEYLYMDLGSAAGSADFVVNPGFAIVERVIGTTTFRDHIFRAGLNYKFGAPSPVVAAY
jgi:outer membrane immunogenic protein